MDYVKSTHVLIADSKFSNFNEQISIPFGDPPQVMLKILRDQ